MMKQNKQINLVPRIELKAQNEQKKRIILSVILLIETVLFVVGIVVPQKLILRHQNEVLDKLDEQLENECFTEVKVVMNELEDVQEVVANWEKQYKRLSQKEQVGMHEIETLLGSIPKGVSISDLQIMETEVGYQIHMCGTTVNYQSIMGYITWLQALYGSSEISYVIDNEPTQGIEYEITLMTSVASLGDETLQDEQVLLELDQDEALLSEEGGEQCE